VKTPSIHKHLIGEAYLVTHRVMKKNSGMRLDRFLMDRYRRRSREQLKRAIDVGAITVVRLGTHHMPGKMKASFSLQDGDIVKVLSKRRPEPAVNFNYQILHEDEDILVVNKPANLPVHPAGRFFFHTLLIHLKTSGFTNNLEAERTLFLVHRIDKETSGVLLLAKSKEACASLTSQFKERQTDKYYLAIVRGTPSKEQFDIDDPIGKMRGSRVGLKVYGVPEADGGQTALTHFEKVETRAGEAGEFTLMACFPRTGRQHQIRVHADLAGIPLVGDKIYGLSDDDAVAILDHTRDLMPSEVSPDPVDEDFSEELSSADFAEPIDEDTDEDTGEDPLRPSHASPRAPLLVKKPGFLQTPERTPRFEIPGPTSTTYAEIEAKLILPRHALHAAGLRFTHPRTGKLMAFESGLPDDLRAFFEGLTHEELAPFRTRHW
jgi:23S rRNA pseudouridine1911/1915/1917 synthase